MATGKLIKHGTQAGYDAERKTGHICDRCRTAHRVYNRQFSKAYKASGGKRYGAHDVIDHLESQGHARTGQGHPRATGGEHTARPPVSQPEPPAPDYAGTGAPGPDGEAEGRTAPGLGERLSTSLRNLVVPSRDEYVNEDGSPDYLHPIDPDPEPNDSGGEWSQGDYQEEFIVNKAGMQIIEDNLGTYLSVIGITMEMVDPYCGPIIAENMENIVGRWSKVIARYPRAANIFLNKDGGTIMLWIGALQATWPVLYAIYEHHLAKNVQTDKEGRSYRVTTPSSPNGHNVDATMPPMPGYNYTVD